jgi:hypothetical protein
MGFFNLFGGDKKSTTTQTVTMGQDQKVQIGGSAGTVISPGAAVSTPGGGAITASPYATVTQTITSSGTAAADVQKMLDSVFANESEDRAAMSELAGSLSSGLAAQGQRLAEIVSAAKAPEQTALASILPWLLLGLFLWLVGSH